MFANTLQLAALGLMAAATVRFAGVNAGLVVIAAILFLIALAIEGGKINVAATLIRAAQRVARIWEPLEELDPDDEPA